MSQVQFNVYPNAPTRKTIKFPKNASWEPENKFIRFVYIATGWVLGLIIFYILFQVTMNIAVYKFGVNPNNTGPWSIPICLTPIALTFTLIYIVNRIISNIKNSELEVKASEEAFENDKRIALDEANSLAKNINDIYESSIKLKAELAEHIEQASLWLEDAEDEYEDNAFTPFWDAVEKAARHLARYDEKVNRLSKNAQEYCQKLKGREHNFPSFPVQSRTIPDSSFVLKEFRRIVRLGQTHHHFDNNFQHRRTQKILIAGFNSLGEAINNLHSTIEDSIADFQEIVSSDSARIVEEQIKTRETIDKTGKSLNKRMLEQNRILDNIQDNKKPN